MMSLFFLFLLQPRTSIILLLFTLFRMQGETSSHEAVVSSVSEGPLTGMEFAYIPSGNFLMGSTATEGVPENEHPQHSVEISAFELMTTEVTQGMWEEVMGETAFENRNMDKGEGEDYPMYRVSWNDCDDFIQRLNGIDRSYHYRLPSESEWEYACRAGTTTLFYWGDSDSESVMDNFCWYRLNSDFVAHPVALKQPNDWGLYDMSGNSAEWCYDWYYDSYNEAPANGSARESSGSSSGVARGGSWSTVSMSCRSASRCGVSFIYGSPDGGFRLVRSPVL
ncbi:MAG: formylglycine-generating enzyme family protein [Candidatus Fermentibacteria bacterium]|nr:formylglycine-generating enzyme family protein [Candidatus Fermentibacteria bacterium]